MTHHRAPLLKGSELHQRAPLLPTGIPPLDHLLSGGVPRGRITELVGPVSCGKTGLALAILAQVTSRGEWVAYIDPLFSLDPLSASGAGIDLERFLWIQGKAPFSGERALKAADILVQAGGLGAIVLDLETRTACQEPPRFPSHPWFRLQRALKGSLTILLVLGSEAMAGSAASLAISLYLHKAQWSFAAEGRKASLGPPHARLLNGISSQAELLRGSNHRHVTLHCRL